jgi:hypothetical protein
MKTRPVGAALIYADGRTDRQTDMTKLRGAFRDHANAPNKSYQKHILMEVITGLHHI